jgi:antitoxin VapB
MMLQYIYVYTFMGNLMHSTKIFRNGNSQAVRIPAELSYDRTDVEMLIERIGDELRIRPARQSLAGLMERFARFSPEFMAQGRGKHEQHERDVL